MDGAFWPLFMPRLETDNLILHWVKNVGSISHLYPFLYCLARAFSATKILLLDLKAIKNVSAVQKISWYLTYYI